MAFMLLAWPGSPAVDDGCGREETGGRLLISVARPCSLLASRRSTTSAANALDAILSFFIFLMQPL
jgi:hypothetical protein